MCAEPRGRSAPEYPVFVKRGDALAEIDAAVKALGGSPARAGLHKVIYAAQADQTVAMVTSRDAPLAAALRSGGWAEPREME
jgi:hypothetical protein